MNNNTNIEAHYYLQNSERTNPILKPHLRKISNTPNSVNIVLTEKSSQDPHKYSYKSVSAFACNNYRVFIISRFFNSINLQQRYIHVIT